MSNLNELIGLCKACVAIEINDHKSVYTSVAEHMNEHPACEFLHEIEPDVLQKMIDTDTVIDIQFYPDTPIGFYKIYHYDIDMAIDMAIDIIKKR